MRLLLALLALVAAIGLLGCRHELVPPLVEVSELGPREVEAGDRLELRGTGFPQGRPARVTFEGTLHRAGEPDATASIDAEGVVVTTERVEVAVHESLEERFCGRGDHAAHATFEGDVEVAFASRDPAAPPLVGVLRGVTLDVRPTSVRAGVLEERAVEGGRVLAFLGIAAGPATARGLPIEEVAPGSMAASFGLLPGDVLSAVDGVHVLGTEDVLPASSRSVQLTVRHAEAGNEETISVPMTGYAGRRVPRELEPALVIVALALAALLLLVVPGPALLTRIEIGLTSRLRACSWSSVLKSALGRRADVAASVLTTAVIATFALSPHVFGPDIDGVVLLVAASALLVASRAAEARGFVATVRVALEVAVCLLVVVAALVELAVLGGAVHLAELVRAQGGAPWEAAAAQKPAATVLACAYAAALLSIVRVRVSPSEPLGARARVFERVGVLCASALLAAAFLGGWQLPGGLEARSTILRALGALVFVAKTWAVAGVLWGVASLVSPWAPADARRFAIKKLVPLLAVSALLVVVARRLTPSAALENAFGATAFAAGVILVVRTASRVRSALGRAEPHASPFL